MAACARTGSRPSSSGCRPPTRCEPRSELVYTTVFELLAAVLLSAQATDVGVNKATRRLFPVANTPQAILDLGLDGLEQAIRTIGLYRSKARHLMETCRILVERHGGQVPRARAELEALPGVGRKTANVVLNARPSASPPLAVDTHVFRVANRTGLAPGRDVLAVEQALMRRVPPRFLADAHHWLVLHGRYVCQARQPCGRAAPCAGATTCPRRATARHNPPMGPHPPLLDPRTIVLLTGVMGGLMAVVMVFLRRNYPASVKGLGHWAFATSLLFFGGLAAGARHRARSGVDHAGEPPDLQRLLPAVHRHEPLLRQSRRAGHAWA